MTPALRRRRAAKASPLRLAFTYVPNGVTLPDWTPAEHGPRVRPARASSSRWRPTATTCSCSPGSRTRTRTRSATAPAITRARPPRTSPASTPEDGRRRHPERHLGRSDRGRAHRQRHAVPLDRARLRRLAHRRQLRLRLQLRVHQQPVWRSPTTPMPPETNPRLVFERLFGAFDAGLDPDDARRGACSTAAASSTRSSERTRALVGDLGPSDRRKVDEYLLVDPRDRAADRARRAGHARPAARHRRSRRGVPVLFADYVKLMFDLQVVAFQADLTRVVDDDDGPRGQHPDVPGDRRARPAPPAHAPRRQAGLDRARDADQHASTWSCSRTSSSS